MRILFLCTGNSCRSQIAEGFARTLASPGVEVFSAGTAPVGVNPRAVDVMRERGVDISHHRSKDLHEVPSDPDLVVTLCDEAARHCGAFSSRTELVHWGLSDPAHATGSDSEVRRAFRTVRDEVESRLRALFADRGLLAGGSPG